MCNATAEPSVFGKFLIDVHRVVIASDVSKAVNVVVCNRLGKRRRIADLEFHELSTDFVDYTDFRTRGRSSRQEQEQTHSNLDSCSCILLLLLSSLVYCAFKNFRTAALNSASFSTLGTCPHSSKTMSEEFVISFLNLSPSLNGMSPSWRPHAIRVGCLIDRTWLSIKSSPRITESIMLLMV